MRRFKLFVLSFFGWVREGNVKIVFFRLFFFFGKFYNINYLIEV